MSLIELRSGRGAEETSNDTVLCRTGARFGLCVVCAHRVIKLAHWRYQTSETPLPASAPCSLLLSCVSRQTVIHGSCRAPTRPNTRRAHTAAHTRDRPTGPTGPTDRRDRATSRAENPSTRSFNTKLSFLRLSGELLFHSLISTLPQPRE